MSMHFEASSSVTLLFDFWDVHGPAGMVLSVLVVLLLTVFYELLKVWKIILGEHTAAPPCPPPLSPVPPPFSPAPHCLLPGLEGEGSMTALTPSQSEASLTPTDTSPATAHSNRITHSRLRCHMLAVLHMLQVSLGYMLMLCVMSYNVWVFLGVVAGSTLAYFLAFPLLGRV